MTDTEPRDLLPDWGPYSKKYMGISKVLRESAADGLRFDLCVHPTLENSSVPVPNLTFPAGFHPWEAAPDLSYYSYRYDLEWKDVVYADVAFVRLGEDAVLVRTEFVNHSPMGQNVCLNYYAALESPFPTACRAEFPKKCVWKKFADYDRYEYCTPRPWEHLNPDGMRKGVFFDPAFFRNQGVGERVGGGGLDHVHHPPFGAEKGDMVSLTLPVTEPFTDGVLVIRGCAVSQEQDCSFSVRVSCQDTVFSDTVITFPAGEGLVFVEVPLGPVMSGELQIVAAGTGTGGGELDFAALKEAGSEIRMHQVSTAAVPETETLGDGYLLRYSNVSEVFHLFPLSGGHHIRQIGTGCLEDCLVNRLSQPDITFDDTTRTFSNSFSRKHSDEGFYWNLVTDSRYLSAGERHVEYLVVGGMDAVCSKDELEKRYLSARKAAAFPKLLPDGEPYSFSGRLLRTALLTNLVYPVWRHGKWVKHHTPGKRWDSVYTWDSGFIGLGLLEWEPRLAEYILKLYFSEPENPDFAFLFHGSPVPVQIYLYFELLQRSADKQRLYQEYPKAKRYYDFLAGKSEGSTTDKFQSRLTTTFDYFYNCSGMDDLPPQVAVHQRRLEAFCAPAVTSSHLIRIGKLLRMIAMHLGAYEDVKVYEQDIALREEALRRYAWDEKSGYFGFVVHDKNGAPLDVLRSEKGENLSKGVDGIYPLIAGACTETQKQRLIGHIFSEKEMFSPVGISSVDMSASYFNHHGYWNGHVWMPHQWFIWKTMLDLGEGEGAWRIARTALDIWKRETDYSYNTYEMFSIATGRGGWFHQFGGLSSPVNIWVCAYYRPGNVTVGFETWLTDTRYDAASDSFSIGFEKENGSGRMIAVTAGSAEEYRVTCGGRPLEFVMRTSGALEISLPMEACTGMIEIRPI